MNNCPLFFGIRTDSFISGVFGIIGNIVKAIIYPRSYMKLALTTQRWVMRKPPFLFSFAV